MASPVSEVLHLLPEARTGATEALGEILEACRKYLLLVAERELAPELRGKGGASDLVQEVMIDALRDFTHFRGDSEEELLAWLRRLLLNNLADFARLYRETGKRQLAREVSLTGDSSASGGGPDPADTDPSPSGLAVGHEEAEVVHAALATLPEDYRQVLLLRYQEELSFEEIGRQLNLTANAARKLWARAAKRLQQKLEPPP
jgi:RNA polymerase sigma-70 factor (ECF subfamily)